FPALGGGPGALDDAERLAIVARAASEWYEERFASGKATGIEEVLICDPRLSVVTGARRAVSALVKAPPPEPRPVSAPTPATTRRTVSGSSGGAAKKPRASSAASKKPRL